MNHGGVCAAQGRARRIAYTQSTSVECEPSRRSLEVHPSFQERRNILHIECRTSLHETEKTLLCNLGSVPLLCYSMCTDIRSGWEQPSSTRELVRFPQSTTNTSPAVFASALDASSHLLVPGTGDSTSRPKASPPPESHGQMRGNLSACTGAFAGRTRHSRASRGPNGYSRSLFARRTACTRSTMPAIAS